MALTSVTSKTYTAILASTSVSAAATQNTSTVDLSTAVGDAVFTAQITNGGTGPTIGCTVKLQYSTDGGTTWRDSGRQRTAPTTNSGVYIFGFIVPQAYKTARLQFTGHTAQAVTCLADANVTNTVSTS